jgi:hypothetical protein
MKECKINGKYSVKCMKNQLETIDCNKLFLIKSECPNKYKNGVSLFQFEKNGVVPKGNECCSECCSDLYGSIIQCQNNLKIYENQMSKFNEIVSHQKTVNRWFKNYCDSRLEGDFNTYEGTQTRWINSMNPYATGPIKTHDYVNVKCRELPEVLRVSNEEVDKYYFDY